MPRDPLALRVKRPRRKKVKTYHRNKENNVDRALVYITRRIARGDYDPNKPSDVRAAKYARARGIIDKDNNILKEEYLICQTKRVQQS